MGEYATYKGQQVKIGTCESMYYLRADQAHEVTAKSGNVDPMSDRDRAAIRFRFPFPDEDGTEPGAFGDFDRGQPLPGFSGDPEAHGTVQFKAEGAWGQYLVCLPCPVLGSAGVLSLTSDGSDHKYRVGRNGGHGAVTELIQQAYRERGQLVSVVRCSMCHAMWRLPELSDAQPVIDCLHKMADDVLARDGSELIAVQYRTMADRVAAGYFPADVTETAAVSV